MIDHDKPVRVIHNWKHDCYSILQNGRLKASARQVRLSDVEFCVRESGRERMLRNQRRNIHAYAIGHLLDFVHPDDDRDLGGMSGRSVYYDPYGFAYFADKDTQAPVNSARIVQFDERGVVYSDLVSEL
ncbi:MAG: hypothetical protein OES26_08590 [Gammaproteobacteria bacterium]|nr:hypothetical protein [Gammaproteobacteria bacterium]